MGKIRYIFWEETKRTLANGNFVCLVLAVVCIVSLVPIGLSDNSLTNSFMILFFTEEELLKTEPNLFFSMVMSQAYGPYFVMFTPLIVGLTVLPVLSEDWESGRSRYTLVRCGKVKLLIGKLLTSCFSGGVVIFCGAMCMAAVLYGVLEHDVEFMALTKLYGVFFVYGAVCGLWCFVISGVVRNAYLLACLPYIFLWFVERSYCNVEPDMYMNRPVMEFLKNVLYDYRHSYFIKEIGLKALFFYGCLGILGICIHLAMMKRRGDCGQ